MMKQEFTTTLAEWIGLNEAIFIQRLHGLLVESPKGLWVRRTLDDCLIDFPFWDDGIIKRTIQNLRQDNLIVARYDLNESKQNRSAWYTISYEALSMLTGPVDRLKVKALKRRQARSLRQLDNRPGFIYLAQIPTEPGYKIGQSIDVLLRMNQLGATLIHSFPTGNMAETEYGLHQKFADKRLQGEQFDLTPDDIRAVLLLAN